jgi:glycosyltransferase involved in cell wall biosynthesis
MRLLFAFDHRFYRGPGGEVHTSGAFPAWVWDRYLDHFDEVRVIARDGGPVPEGANLGRADKDRVSFDFVPSLASLRQLIAPTPEVTAKMREALAWADAVVARIPSEIGLMAASEALRAGKPYAVEVMGCAWDGWVHHGSPIARLYAPMMLHRTRRAVKNAPMALYVTSRWLQDRYPTSAPSISASNVDVFPFTQDALARRERRLKEIAEGRPPILGTIAALKVKTKGVQTAIEALSRLRTAGLELTYRVLGPGPVEPWKQLAEKWGVADLIHFDGTRSAGEGVAAWLDEIDIHLQPSFQEGLPRATIEAMSRGVACIGSTCGGIPELLPADRLHRPGDVAGLVDRIRRLVSDPAAIQAASAADRETARQFDREVLKRRRYDFFAQLRALAEEKSGPAAEARS